MKRVEGTERRPYSGGEGASRWQRLKYAKEVDRLTHYLFRYPAKFHPPVVRTLLEMFTTRSDLVLDPFCGSGTLMVEAAVAGRSSFGIDVDPVAVAVARAKIHRYQATRLKCSAEHVLTSLERYHRPDKEYERRKFSDLTKSEYEAQVKPVAQWVPALPNLFHWFRRYVVVDLAWIRHVIESVTVPKTHKEFLRVVFASIIRNTSNADPVPVSGLEVTAYMKRRDEQGRLIDSFSAFARALERALEASESFAKRVCPGGSARVIQGDATQLDRYLHSMIDAVITSPPYHGAVDYYRRHKLEMFWLDHTRNTKERLALLNRYIGRFNVPQHHPYVSDNVLKTDLAKRWEARIRKVSHERANAFRHYLVAMTKFFASLADHVRVGSPIVLVVGHGAWNNTRIPTTQLFTEIASSKFRLRRVFWYPLKNRYMSYDRHNNASINKEYVLVFERRPSC